MENHHLWSTPSQYEVYVHGATLCVSLTSNTVQQNLYTILGVASTATIEDIKKAFNKEALKWHPDKCPEKTNPQMMQQYAERFRALSRAREVLCDEDARSQYDKSNVPDENVELTNPDELLFRAVCESIVNQHKNGIQWFRVSGTLIVIGCLAKFACACRHRAVVDITLMITLIGLNAQGFKEHVKSLSTNDKNVLCEAMLALLQRLSETEDDNNL